MRLTKIVPLALLFLLPGYGSGCTAMGLRKDTSYQPHIEPADFSATVNNPYFPLPPGTTWKYTEKDKGEVAENVVTVTHDTKVVMGVTCVVVHDVLTKNGRVAEDTYDWYAQDKDGAVWYFGETTKEITSGGRVNTKGSWEGGVAGAQPGIIMPGRAAPGEAYRQEYAHGEAEDMGQIVAVGESVTVPFGIFADCVKTKDYSLLEAGGENKWYAKGVGFVHSESSGGEVVDLVSMTRE